MSNDKAQMSNEVQSPNDKTAYFSRLDFNCDLDSGIQVS